MSSVSSSSPYQLAVVGDDGRVGGDSALAAAQFLQSKLGTRTHVVHSIDVPVVSGGSHPEELVNVRAKLAERAEAWLAMRVADKLGPDADMRVELGRPATALLRATRSMSGDVIIIGPHEQKGLFDFGGTQRSVFGDESADVWCQPTPEVKVDRIVVPFDFDERSQSALTRALQLAPAFGVEVLVMHCSEAIGFVDPMPAYAGEDGMPVYVVDAIHDAAKLRFEAWFEAQSFEGSDVSHEFIMGNPAESLIREQRPSDLIVMGTRGHTGMAAALMGGVTYAVLKAHKGPVLAIHQ